MNLAHLFDRRKDGALETIIRYLQYSKGGRICRSELSDLVSLDYTCDGVMKPFNVLSNAARVEVCPK